MSSFYAKYNQILKKRPVLTNVVTTAFLFGTGDALAQKVANRNKPKPHDSLRTLRAVIYGGVIFAPMADKWYKVLGAVKIPSWKSPAADLIARVGLDQGVFAPFIGIPLYYTMMTMMEGGDMRAIKNKIQNNWFDTLYTNWLVWPGVQLVNFAVVPVHFRLLVVNVVSIGWNCYLLMIMNGDTLERVGEDQVLI